MLCIRDDPVLFEVTGDFRSDYVLEKLAANAGQRHGAIVSNLTTVTLLETGLDQRMLPDGRNLAGE